LCKRKKWHFCLSKIATQGVSLWHFHKDLNITHTSFWYSKIACNCSEVLMTTQSINTYFGCYMYHIWKNTQKLHWHVTFFVWYWGLNSGLSCLLGRCSTTWATPLVLFAIVILETGSCFFFFFFCLSQPGLHSS
jgi:hypothetical protein